MISIIIVNYNSGELLKRCVDSIYENVTLKFEILIIDNDSRDRSMTDLADRPGLRPLAQHANLGFAKGCNKGAQNAKGELLHFLNPDAEVTRDINVAYAQALATAGPSIFSTKIIDENDREVKTSFAFPTFTNLKAMLTRKPIDRWFIGASVIIKPETFKKLGGFSEEYTLYSEDTDLFYKAHLHGVKIAQLDAHVLHRQGGSSRQVWSARQRLLRTEASGLLFARKFNLRFPYFVFKHLGFVKSLRVEPLHALLELGTFWQILLFGGQATLPPSQKKQEKS